MDRKLKTLYFNIILLLYLSLSFENIYGQTASFQIKNYSKNDYVAEYQNWAVDLGNDEFVYFANNAGLLVFDGLNWDFHTSKEITNLRTVKVNPRDGRIYTSGYRELGYWEWDSVGTLHYNSLNMLAEQYFSDNEEFWKIVIHDNEIIFQSFQGLFIYAADSFRIVRPKGFVNNIADIKGELIITILNQGIFKIRNDEAIPYFTGSFFDQKLVRFILPWNDSQLLIGTASHGVYSFDGRNIKPVFAELTDYLSKNTINRACLIDSTKLLIGTILDGIIILDENGKTLYSINEEKGLQNNTILGIHRNMDCIWLALDRGVSFVNLDRDPSYEIHTIQEIGATYTAAVFENKIFLGTNQGLYYKFLNEKDDDFRLFPGTQGQVWDCKVYDDQLFIGHNNGTYILKDDRLRQISFTGGGFCLIKNPYRINSLLQSTYSNLLFFEKQKNEWQNRHSIANFSDLIRYIELDHMNNLWASHMRRAVYKLKLNDSQDSVIESSYYGNNSIFNKEYGIDVFKLENRIIFTSGEKIYTYDDFHDTIIPYTQLNNKLGAFAATHRIIKAPDHHYWFITSTSTGLFHFQQRELKLIKEYPSEIFMKHTIDGYENIIPTEPQKAIYCLENGYALLDASPKPAGRPEQAIPLSLRKIWLTDKSGSEIYLEPGRKKYTIPYAKNNLHLLYAYPDYKAQLLRFRIQIKGLQTNWSEAESISRFDITRIPTGDYVINVMAENEWLKSSQVHQLYIKVLSPWYRSSLAWIIYFIFLISVAYFIWNISVKRIKANEKKKRDLKEQELVRLRNQNLRVELSFKSKELANSTMSIIKKNEFLLDLKNLLKEQKYQLGSRYPDKFYTHIIKKIDKNISTGDDWKIFETNVEKAHEFFLQKLINEYPRLTHSDLRLATYLRMNLSSKEIAPLMKISVRGVENHRYRLRKKLGLQGDVNLTDFIIAFEI